MSTAYVTKERIIGRVDLPLCSKCRSPLFLTYKQGIGTGDPDVPYSVCLHCGTETKITKVIYS